MNNYVGNIGSTFIQNSSDLNEIEAIKRGTKSQKEQLKKVATEFESIFIAKMMNEMEKTVDREGSLFQESKYMDSLKSVMYADIGKNIANSPTTSIGIAKQIYEQMQHTVSD